MGLWRLWRTGSEKRSTLRLSICAIFPLTLVVTPALAQSGGLKVTVFDAADQVLSREDADAAEIIGRHLVADGPT